MAGQSNAAPAIIKRKKIVQGGAHHGGAWKVAYADFVTAMMAFFMLMWLLNATTERQRKGIADYFNPTVPINRMSGGGDGAFGGDSIFSEDVLTRIGTGASLSQPTEDRQARGLNTPAKNEAGRDRAARTARPDQRGAAGAGGESLTMKRLLRHVVTRVTEEGLVIELFDLEEATLFAGDTAEPNPVLREIAALLSEVLGLTSNGLAIGGHVKSFPITLIRNPGWSLSSDRAQALRRALEDAGLEAGASSAWRVMPTDAPQRPIPPRRATTGSR